MKQLSSSEPSVQSLLLSQSSASGMHFPFLQRKKESLHLFSAAGGRGGGSGQHEAAGQPCSPAVAPAGTWAAAAWVLGRLVRVVVAVELAVTLPLPVAEAAAVGAAELVGAAGGILCGKAVGSDGAAHLPEPAGSDGGTVAAELHCTELWHGCPNLPASRLGTGLCRRGQGGGKRGWFWISPKLLCARVDALQWGWGGQLSCTEPLSLPLLVPPHPALTSNPFWMMKTLPGSRLKAQETLHGCQGQCYRKYSPHCPPPSRGHPPHSGDSSEPSPQSSSWSQTKCLGMHCRFPHMNSRSSHVLLYTATRHRCQPPTRLCALLPAPPALRPLSWGTGDKS